jgi:NADPH-dependent ferric siderophore reductase
MLRDAVVRSVRDVAACFRAVELVGPGLRGCAFQPGDKLQMLLPSRDVRTFTPVYWDGEAGVTELLIYHHAATPAGAWIRGLAVGDTCRFVGPQRSLRLPAQGPVVLFGDETSCAVALALTAAMPDREFACVLESSTETAMRTALGERVAHATLVPREPDEAHMPELVRELQAALARSPGASLLLTGRAQAIQEVRAACKTLVLPRPAGTRAYWSLGKVGLD